MVVVNREESQGLANLLEHIDNLHLVQIPVSIFEGELSRDDINAVRNYQGWNYDLVTFSFAA